MLLRRWDIVVVVIVVDVASIATKNDDDDDDDDASVFGINRSSLWYVMNLWYANETIRILQASWILANLHPLSPRMDNLHVCSLCGRRLT